MTAPEATPARRGSVCMHGKRTAKLQTRMCVLSWLAAGVGVRCPPSSSTRLPSDGALASHRSPAVPSTSARFGSRNRVPKPKVYTRNLRTRDGRGASARERRWLRAGPCILPRSPVFIGRCDSQGACAWDRHNTLGWLAWGECAPGRPSGTMPLLETTDARWCTHTSEHT